MSVGSVTTSSIPSAAVFDLIVAVDVCYYLGQEHNWKHMEEELSRWAGWLTKGGWNPVWGSFTFPIATFTNLQIMAIGKGMGILATAGLVAGLLIGTPLILYIVWMSSKAWIRGELSKKTGAAVA